MKNCVSGFDLITVLMKYFFFIWDGVWGLVVRDVNVFVIINLSVRASGYR